MPQFKVSLVGIDAPTVPDWVREQIEREGIEFVARECTTREELEAAAADADVVWLFGGSKILNNGNLQTLKQCGAIIRTGSGTDNLPVDEATKAGMIVANTPDGLNDTVSDHAIGLLFGAIRRIAVQDRLVRQGVWDRMQAWPNWHLRGQTFGLVGFGHIARMVAKKMSGFEMKFIAFDPYVDQTTMSALNIEKVELDRLLAESDFISLHCPLTRNTRHLVGEDALKKMKSTAVLINTARGPLIDEEALVRALREGWIGAFGADVLETEPPAADHPLLQLDNVVITPHISAYSDVYYDSMWRFSVEAAIDLYHRRWPRSYVNPRVKPRWKMTSRGDR